MTKLTIKMAMCSLIASVVIGCKPSISNDSDDLPSEQSSGSLVPGFDRFASSSYDFQNTDLYIDMNAIRTINRSNFVLAVAYADFDNDGDTDVFMASGDGSVNTSPAELYLNDGTGQFVLDTSFVNGLPPGGVHPRKALVGDFNGDGTQDVFVIAHGYDQSPFPGESPFAILSSVSGFEAGTGLEDLIGFQHGGSSADIDGDGDIDVFVTDTAGSFFLLNDGFGNFTVDYSKISGMNLMGGIYTAELVDVDQDSFIDLLVSGHEHDGFATQILWGSPSGNFQQSTVLPAVSEYGVAIDIDVADLDGDLDLDIVINRTGDGTGGELFYQGYRLQYLENAGDRSFIDQSDARLSTARSTTDNWIDWIRLQDFNGDGAIDIFADDAARGLVWLNDGYGVLQ
jgi:hypothetical protein